MEKTNNGPGTPQREAEQKKSNPFYNTGAWRRLRKVALQRDGGMCQRCLQRMRDGYGGKVHRAEMVHHIQPIELRPDLALNLNNLISLCNECHGDMHPEKGGDHRKQEAKHTMRVIRV